MSNIDIDNVFSEYVLNTIQGIRNNKLRPNNDTVFHNVTKNCAINADASLTDTTN